MAHRGMYAFDKGNSSTEEVHTKGADMKHRQQLVANTLPQWLISAPRTSAKMYVKRVNASISMKMTAAALLFDISPIELEAHVPAPLSGFTIAQLKLPKGSIVIVARLDTSGKALDTGMQAKLAGDERLKLRGQPHTLATVTYKHAGKCLLLKPSEMDATREMLKHERESLALAAQELHDRLLPQFRRKQRGWQEKERRRRAAQYIQSVFRGRTIQQLYEEELRRKRRMRLIGRLIARRAAAVIIRERTNGPILNKRMLMRLAKPSPPRDSTQAEEEEETSLIKVIYANRRKIAKVFSDALNKLLAAAPEASEMKLPKPLLTLLTTDTLSVTAIVHANEVLVGAIKLPDNCVITHLRQNKVNRKQKASIDRSIKLIKEDALTFNIPPHELTLLTEVKAKALCLAVKPKTAFHSEIVRQHEMLMAVASKIATWLTRLVRVRFGQRERARRNYAALAIQLAFSAFMARRRSATNTDVSQSFMQRSALTLAEVDREAAKYSTKFNVVDLGTPRVISSQSKWHTMQQKHRVKSVLGAELKRVRQKKKPSQVKGTRKPSPTKTVKSKAK